MSDEKLLEIIKEILQMEKVNISRNHEYNNLKMVEKIEKLIAKKVSENENN